MKNSLKRKIQCNSFSIFDIKDDTSTFATAQKSCKVLQCIIDAAMHKKNWLQSISIWKMSTWYYYNNMQVQQRSNVDQAHFINMFQMKDKMKSNVMKKEHHELKKALRNHKRSNDDHSNDTFNEYTESISSCDVIKELNEKERK